MKFYLGTHRPGWLAKVDLPLFVSHRILSGYRRLPVALTGWALDSGGFTELSMHGRWTVSPAEYADAVDRYDREIGQLEWAAPQDWMCEPWITAKTGKTVRDHQRLTVDNYLTLREIAPHLPFVPVLQGWQLDDYHRHVEDYLTAGVDVTSLPTVGIGSVCRRQSSSQIDVIVSSIAERGVRLHGFGVKTDGLRRYAHALASADSMAWSYGGRRSPVLCGSTTHKSEANCLTYALRWRQRVLDAIDAPRQLAFGVMA